MEISFNSSIQLSISLSISYDIFESRSLLNP